MSQDINADPEVWEMRHTFGESSLAIWLQILSMADRNEGLMKGNLQGWTDSLLRIYSSGNPRWIRRDRERLQNALRWMSEKGWISLRSASDDYQKPVREGSEDALVVVNYWKYHRTREPNKVPSEPSEPSEPLKKESIAAKPRPVNEEPEWKKIADQIYKSDPKRFGRLMQLINWAAKEMYSEAIIRAGLEKLWRAMQGNQIANWWPYARKCLEKAYTEDQQAQSSRDKKESAQFIATIVKAVAK